MNQQIQALRTQIAGIKKQITQLEELRPGSLSRQYNVCGSPGCRCKATPPQKHGPYYHLSYTRRGKGGTRAVQNVDVPVVKAHLANYARLRTLIDQWIELATDLSDLTIEAARNQKKPARRPR